MKNVRASAVGTSTAIAAAKDAIARDSNPHCSSKKTIKPDNINPSVNAVSVSTGRKLVNATELYKLHFQGFLATISIKNHTGVDNRILCQSTTKRDAPIFLLVGDGRQRVFSFHDN